ncbi:MAG: hypothetical protein IJS99_00605 [Synergistaceae bacterium]|nr:hypothetical protein [Synergistaceae bacterium]
MAHNNKHEYEYEFQDDAGELTLFDIFSVVWRRKFFIIIVTGIFGVYYLVRAFTAPFTYRAETRILPPQSGNRIEGISARLGGLASFVGLPRNATSGQLFIGILRGDSVVDAIVDRFDLMNELSTDKRVSARNAVLESMGANEDRNSGIITISYIHKDPQMAADMANALVGELQHKLQEMAIADAQQKRNFFESQLMQAQQELNQAEDAMINYQQKSGVVVFESQAQALLASIASLKNQIAAKNVEISSMRSYARKDNPQLKLAQSQLDAMTKELHRLEAEQKRSDIEQHDRLISGDSLLSLGKFPELGMEYQRYVRALQFATAKYEMMLRQYEGARLSEANDMTSISVVDYATPPDIKYAPRRARITIMGTGIGLAFSLFWVFTAEYINSMRKKQARKNSDDYDNDEEEDE